MKNNLRICSALLAILIFAVAVSAKEWRGIVPLHSSRQDVLRILGMPNSRDDLFDHYQPNDEEYVNIMYAREPCLGLVYYWGNYAVFANTVLTITINYENGVPLASLNIPNMEKLKRKVDDSLTVYYFDADQGVEYSVQEGNVVAIEYGPAKLDSYLRCADKESHQSTAPPNKSLDASGGSVFRIMIRPAMLE